MPKHLSVYRGISLSKYFDCRKIMLHLLFHVPLTVFIRICVQYALHARQHQSISALSLFFVELVFHYGKLVSVRKQNIPNAKCYDTLRKHHQIRRIEIEVKYRKNDVEVNHTTNLVCYSRQKWKRNKSNENPIGIKELVCT